MVHRFWSRIAFCSLAISVTPAFAGVITFLNAPSVPADQVKWDQLGADQTGVNQNFSATSTLGMAIAGLLGGSDGLTSVVCGAVNPVNCSWESQPSGYAAGDTLLWAENSGYFGSGPISLSFAAQFGLGAVIQTTAPGPFTARLNLYSGSSMLATRNYASDMAGDPLFLGGTDSMREITRAVFTVTGCGSFSCDSADFSMDTVDLYNPAEGNAPEPATMWLAGSLLLLGMWGKSRQKRSQTTNDSERKNTRNFMTTRRTVSTLLTVAALLTFLNPAHAQDEPVIDPLQLQVLNPHWSVQTLAKDSSAASASVRAVAGPKLSIWQYQFTSPRDGNVYQGSIVGGNPLNRGARTTTIPVILVPVRVQFTGAVARTFDPTSPDTGCLGAGKTALSLTQESPLFQPAPWVINGVNVGNVTFPDAFHRAAFWPAVSGVSPAYHLGFNVSIAPKQTILVANGTANGSTYSVSGGCSTSTNAQDNPNALGLLDINFLDPLLNTMISKLGITPNQFPLFLIYGVVLSDGSARNTNNCCILGYHSTTTAATPANPGQTYGIAEYDQNYIFTGIHDASVLSHEVLEWVDDPSVSNLTPPWGHIGQVGNCQTNLEVGDPLTGALMPPVTMPNGVTYHMQELAFPQWFLGAPGPGAGNKYSSNGAFAGYAKGCPPGGSN